MKAFHRVQLPALLLLAYTTQLRCCAAKKPDLDGLTDEEAKYAKLYWDYTVADRVIHTATNSGGGADTRANEAHITAEETRSGYRFFVPHFERLSGLAYVGHGARLRLVLERASSGRRGDLHAATETTYGFAPTYNTRSAHLPTSLSTRTRFQRARPCDVP